MCTFKIHLISNTAELSYKNCNYQIYTFEYSWIFNNSNSLYWGLGYCKNIAPSSMNNKSYFTPGKILNEVKMINCNIFYIDQTINYILLLFFRLQNTTKVLVSLQTLSLNTVSTKNYYCSTWLGWQLNDNLSTQ